MQLQSAQATAPLDHSIKDMKDTDLGERHGSAEIDLRPDPQSRHAVQIARTNRGASWIDFQLTLGRVGLRAFR